MARFSLTGTLHSYGAFGTEPGFVLSTKTHYQGEFQANLKAF